MSCQLDLTKNNPHSLRNLEQVPINFCKNSSASGGHVSKIVYILQFCDIVYTKLNYSIALYLLTIINIPL